MHESLRVGHAVHIDRVDTVADGGEAVEAVRSLPYDLVFMDIKLPGQNGVEVLTELCQVDPNARVIMMTGFSEVALLEEARHAGAIDILRKPFRLKEMFSYIDNIENISPPLVQH